MTPGAPRDVAPPRVVIEAVHPVVDSGRFAAKASTAAPLVIEADIFADGHECLAASAVLRHDASGAELANDLEHVANDRWRGTVSPDRLGPWTLTLSGWLDPWEYWCHSILARRAAGLDISVDVADGIALLASADLAAAATRLESGDLAVAGDAEVASAMRTFAKRGPGTATSEPLPVECARDRAAHGAWYELFPRSLASGQHRTASDQHRTASGQKSRAEAEHGTFADLVGRLDYVANLGFQVVYLPPVHPIGRTARKGPDNSLRAGPDDPGSPWAIGGPEGGHAALHPDLGTEADFQRVVARAQELDMEIALDLAFQCSPEHPWVTEHPDWFLHRADGSIRTAENPPKRYEDIYPIDFACSDWRALWAASADVVRHWIGLGVKIFRVDNPHTKPFPFWQWLIAEIRGQHPDVIFLAEAFTRPRVLERLGKIGFDQSYGYFTWKRTVEELREYFEDLSERTADFLRPNVWPNTPDILTDQLQDGGRPMFEARTIMAATLSANFGVYGPALELMESEPLRRPSEEYRSSEKYQVRHWDLESSETIAPLLRRLNEIRAGHPALLTDATRVFHNCDDPGTICWSKQSFDGTDTVLVVVNAEADRTRSGLVRLDLDAIGVDAHTPFRVRDLLDGAEYEWFGADNFVLLDPQRAVAHVFEIIR